MAKYKGQRIKLNEKEYVIGEEIGAGANGCVRFAKVEGESTEYAIKFLSMNDREKRERFERELRFCEEAEHQNILKVYGHGELNGELFYIMPYYPKTLRTVIDEERDALRLLSYSIQLSEAVKYIHDRGMIHRDIKPENILVDDEGNIVLADFGIAHFVNSMLTKTNEWLANKSYSAPEQQIKGAAKNITLACDIYATGEIINELITKEKPSGAKFKTISDVEPFMYLLDDLVYRCMQQNPAERPNIDEVLAELKLISGDIERGMFEISHKVNSNGSQNSVIPSNEVPTFLKVIHKDIMLAKYIFENVSQEDIQKFNLNYHGNICYKVSSYLKKSCFIKELYSKCQNKFNYEAHVYSNGSHYAPLNLEKSEDLVYYKKWRQL